MRVAAPRAGHVLAAALALVALCIPSGAWLTALGVARTADLTAGVWLFRSGLLLLAVFGVAVTAGSWWRWAAPIGQLEPGTAQGQASAPPTRPKWTRLEVAVLASLLTVGALLRVHRLGEGLWLDEVLTLVNYGHRSFGEILTTYDSQNQHFLFSLLARASLLTFGDNAWALRLPAALFGVGGILALHLVGRQVTTRAESLWATALLTFSYHHVWFSQNARGYSGLLFWTLLSSWLLLKALGSPDLRVWFGYAATASLGVFTHMTMLFVIVGQFLVLALATWRARARWIDWLPGLLGFTLAALLVFELHALVLPQILGPGLAETSMVATWRSPFWALRETLSRFHLGPLQGVGALLGSAVVAAGSLSYCRRRWETPVLFWVPVIVGGSVVVAMQHNVWPRFFFFAAGFALLIVVRGLVVWAELVVSLTRAKLGAAQLSLVRWAAPALLVLASVATLPAAYGPKQDYERARDFVNQHRGASDTVVAVGLAAFPFKNHYAPDWTTTETVDGLVLATARSERTWVLYTLSMHMEAVHKDILELLRARFVLVREFPGSLGDGTIYVWRSRDTGRERDRASEQLPTSAARAPTLVDLAPARRGPAPD